MKRMLALVLITIMAVTGLSVYGAPGEVNISLQIGNPNMTVGGTEKPIDETGTAPILTEEGRTLLPVRAVVEEMGGTVAWDGTTQTATLTYGEDEIRLTIDSTTAYLSGEAQTLDVAPVLRNDRTMLPIRFIAESFHFNVDWDDATQTATITKGEDSMQTGGNAQVSDSLLLIPGGSFRMGSPEDEPEREADEMVHDVTLDSFYMAKTEVTQAAYQALMGENPSEEQGDNLPVTNVTWYDAIRYCNALSEAESLTPCYALEGDTVTWDRAANGYRLSTEAEWEYAARANTATSFSFGDYVHDSDANCYNAYGYNNDATGNWVNGYLGHTVAVDSYNANPYGLYNVHGNAGEWVWDWYGTYDTEAATNPTGAESGRYKVVRGGGWNDFPKHIRSAYRSAFPADVPFYSIGIRLARNDAGAEGTVRSVNDAKPNPTSGKVLIAYFSQTGNTDGFADIIAEMTGADVFRIERATPYSSQTNGYGLYSEALNEQRENAVPELKAYLEDAGLDMDDYSTILLGYCNWWASIPAPVRSFLKRYDLSGKEIIPFCSMGGGRFGQTISAVAKLAPNSRIKKGHDVTYASYDRDGIAAWLAENGIMQINNNK